MHTVNLKRFLLDVRPLINLNSKQLDDLIEKSESIFELSKKEKNPITSNLLKITSLKIKYDVYYEISLRN